MITRADASVDRAPPGRRELAGDAPDVVRGQARPHGDGLGREVRGEAAHLLDAVHLPGEIAQVDEALLEEHVRESEQQRSVTAGPNGQPLVGVVRRAGAARIDDHHLAAARADRVEAAEHVGAGEQAALGGVRVGAHHDQVVAAVHVRHRERPHAAEEQRVRHVLRPLVDGARRVDDGDLRHRDERGRVPGEREVVGDRIAEVGRHRADPVLFDHRTEQAVHLLERFLPADLHEALAPAHERGAQAVGIFVQLAERGPLRTDVPAAPDVVLVRPDLRDGPALYGHAEPAHGLAERAGLHVGAVGRHRVLQGAGRYPNAARAAGARRSPYRAAYAPASVSTRAVRPLPRLHRLFPNVYYGWIVVAGTFLQSLVCVGIGFYSQQVLVDALTAVRGFARVDVSAASSVFFLLTGAFGFAIGPLVDRYGARAFIFAGALVQGVALVAIGRTQDAAWLIPTFALLSFGFALSTGVPTSAILTRWFVARRSLATTFSQTGVSLGGAIMIPLGTFLIHDRGLEWATAAMALAIAIVTIPVVVFVLRWDPAEHGLEPDGSIEAARASRHVSLEAQRRVWRRREALATPTFWLLATAFGCVLAAQVGMIAHQLAALAERMPRATAMWGGSLIPIGSVLGRFAIGAVADRFEKRHLAVSLFAVQGLGILAFSLSESPTALFASSLLFGLTIGSIFMMQSLITADLFGIPSFGAVYGAVQLCSQLASSTGPLIVGALYATYGGYPTALRWLVLLSFLGAALLARVRPPAAAPAGDRLVSS